MYLLLMVALQLGVGIYRSLASEVISLGDQLASIVRSHYNIISEIYRSDLISFNFGGYFRRLR